SGTSLTKFWSHSVVYCFALIRPTKSPSYDDFPDHPEPAPTPFPVDRVPEQNVPKNAGRCPHFGTPPTEGRYSEPLPQTIEYRRADFLFSRPRCAFPKTRTPSPLRLGAT